MVQSSILKRLVGALLLLTLAVVTGCNSRGTDGLDTATYRIEGGMVVDLNRDSTYIATRVFRNDSTFTDAVVQVDNRVIPYSDLSLGLDSAYTLVDETVATYLAEILPVILLDNTEFGDTLLIPAADSFSIEITDPALRLLQPLGNVQLEWTGAANAGGYILAAVHRDSTYQGWGYSLTSLNAQTNLGTIPPDAFVLTDGLNPDTGWYDVYVYALTGTPDSALVDELLPAPMPQQFTDNITGDDLTGRFGVLIVALKDSIRVAVQP